MLEIVYRKGRFLARGSFFLGLAGTYVNKNFTDEMIMVEGSVEYITKELQAVETWRYEPLRPYFAAESLDGTGMARALTKYYNRQEEELRRNIKQVNDCIWYNLFENLEMCQYPFWEIRQAVLPGALSQYFPEELAEVVYAHCEESTLAWWPDFYDKPNNGSLKKVDVEGNLRRLYPMFNFDGLAKSVIPEGLTLDGRFLEFQFSDGWGGALFESACDRFDENFASCDWHNH